MAIIMTKESHSTMILSIWKAIASRTKRKQALDPPTTCSSNWREGQRWLSVEAINEDNQIRAGIYVMFAPQIFDLIK